jgi:oligopeptide/dipeptide ABC transporter ATP-binding protein
MSVVEQGRPGGPETLAAGQEPPLLSVRDLRVYFATKRGIVHAVDGVDLDIREGEMLGLVGETGSGKSMTARSLIRLVPRPPGIFAGGSVLFRPRAECTACGGARCEACHHTGRVPAACPGCSGAGCPRCDHSGRMTVDLLTVSDRQIRSIRGNHIAMIFQDPGKALNPAMPIREQLAEVFAEHRAREVLEQARPGGPTHGLLRRYVRGRSTMAERTVLAVPPLRSARRRTRAAMDDRIAQALADTRIPNPRKVMDRYPHELSGGMKQRVMIAQALAANPELLIADEPTTALDVTIQVRILDLLAELKERFHTAVLYISHDLSLVRRISDRVAVMYAGRLVEVGPAGRVLDDPLHPYTEGLIGAVPSPARRRGELVAIEGTVPELITPPAACRFAGRCPYHAAACDQLDPALHTHGPDRAVACFRYRQAADLGVPPDAMPERGVAR